MHINKVVKAAPEAILTPQLILNSWTIWKCNFGMLLNNTDGYYNSIPPSLAEIAPSNRLPTVVQAHTIAQWNMHHYIKQDLTIHMGI